MTALREGFDYAFSRLDPMAAHIDPPSVAIYETLLTKGLDRQAHPGLARVADISDSQLEWTLVLRDGARFHSGDPCDARAVVDSLEALRWHVPGSRQLWYWDPVDTVAAVDERTIRFRLQYPYRRLPALLWGTHTAVFNRAAQVERPDEFGVSLCDGTGPFRFERRSPGRIVASRFPGYPGPSGQPGYAGELDSIEWLSIPDPKDRLDALIQGDLHCLHGVDYVDLPRLVEDSRFHVYEEPQPSNMYLSLNWERTDLGFDDVRVRRAISSAIDRESLVDGALHGHGRPTWGPLPPGTEHYDPAVDAAGRHDLSTAERELTALGWQRGPDGIMARDGARLSFECVVQRDPVFEAVAGRLAEQLRRLGVDLRIRTAMPFEDFYAACAAGPDSSISKWLWPDPMDALIGFSSTSTAPFPNWSNASVPRLDALFESWLRASTEEELSASASAVQRTFADELPYIPLLSPNDVWAWSAEVTGFRPSPDILYPLYQGVGLLPESPLA